jgi:tRNA threonylcarbamoyl adenosine modification protein YeaZ
MRLALVTCGPQVEVALDGEGMRAPSLVRLAGTTPHTSLLMAAVDLLFEDAGMSPDCLELVVVSRGPGSFTGIRAGLASAAGLAAGTGAEVRAFDSLTMQAARTLPHEVVWAAQPGRRGEVYGRPFRIGVGRPPEATDELRIVAVADLGQCGPWVAADALDLGTARRAPVAWSAAEALLRLERQGLAPQAVEPLYVEGPPIHGTRG